MPINDVFDKVYVLTIERNKDRHSQVEENLRGIDFEYWYGTDVPQLFPEGVSVWEMPDEFFKERGIDKLSVGGHTKGQLGAYYSIAEMWKHIAKQGYERTLIFEDDFSPLRSDWQGITEKAIKELPENWHVLYLGYIYDGGLYKYNYSRTLRTFTQLLSDADIQPYRISKHVDKSGLVNGGHAYCLSNEGAHYLSAFLKPMKKAGDKLLWQLTKDRMLNAYAVYPNLFKQDLDKFSSKTEIT